MEITIINEDCLNVISCSHDGTIKVWVVKSTDCAFSFNLKQISGKQTIIQDIHLNPIARHDQIFCCLDSNTVVLCHLDGKLIQAYKNKSKKSVQDHFTHICPSTRGQFLYCTSETSLMYVFNVETAELVFIQRIHSGEILGCIHHPHRNILTTFASDRTVKIWRM